MREVIREETEKQSRPYIKKHPLLLCTSEMQYTCRECCNISQRGTERKKKRCRQAGARAHAHTNTYLYAQNEEPVRLKEGIEWCANRQHI